MEPAAEVENACAAAPEIRVTFNKAETEAYVRLFPPVPVDPEAIQAALQAAGVVVGIKDDAVQAIAEFPPTTEVVVAEGSEPAPGENAVIEYLFLRMEGIHPLEEAGGRVDHREVRTVDSTYPGQVLARKIMAKPGAPGLSVKGAPIAAAVGKDVPLAAGKNTHLSADGLEVIADSVGRPIIEGNRVSVTPILEIQDVDFSTGNINFEGSLQIRGNVLPGFAVQATGDIEVAGWVEGAQIKAGRNLHVRGSVRAKADLEAAADLTVRYADSDSVLRAGGSITVETDAVQCTLQAHRRIVVKRHLIGGHAKAGLEIEAQVIGNLSETPTQVEVGEAHPEEKLAQLHEEITRAKETLPLLSDQLAHALSEPHTPEKIHLSRKLLQAKVSADRHLAMLQAQLNEHEGPDVPLCVKVHDRVFGGSLVVMAGIQHPVHGLQRTPTFIFADGEVTIK